MKRTVPEPADMQPVKSETNLKNDSGVPERMLPSSDIDIKASEEKNAIRNMQNLSPLKRGILWAEILGKPGGRHRRNT